MSIGQLSKEQNQLYEANDVAVVERIASTVILDKTLGPLVDSAFLAQALVAAELRVDQNGIGQKRRAEAERAGLIAQPGETKEADGGKQMSAEEWNRSLYYIGTMRLNTPVQDERPAYVHPDDPQVEGQPKTYLVDLPTEHEDPYTKQAELLSMWRDAKIDIDGVHLIPVEDEALIAGDVPGSFGEWQHQPEKPELYRVWVNAGPVLKAEIQEKMEG